MNDRLEHELETIKSLREVLEKSDGLMTVIMQQQAEISRLRAELDAEREKQRWIPCNERLPEKDASCIVVLRDDLGEWLDTRIYLGEPIGWDLYSSVAIYWRPLPEPPEEQPENTTITITGDVPRGKPLAYFGDEEQQP